MATTLHTCEGCGRRVPVLIDDGCPLCEATYLADQEARLDAHLMMLGTLVCEMLDGPSGSPAAHPDDIRDIVASMVEHYSKGDARRLSEWRADASLARERVAEGAE